MTKNNLSTMRGLVPLFLLFSVTSLSQAGHFEVTYSGGHGTIGSYPIPYSYNSSTGFYGGGGTTGSGAITAKFTWKKDYPTDTALPPNVVYVKETCNAGGFTDDGSMPQADNDLKSGEVTTTTHPIPGITYTNVTSNGSRVSKQTINGALTFEITASPYASSGGQTHSSVNYAASITIYAAGISSDRDLSYYVGDQRFRHPNDLSKLTPRFGDTAVAFDPADGSFFGHPDRYKCSPIFSSILEGFTIASTLWSDGDSTSYESPFNPAWIYSIDDVQGWVQSGGPTKKITLTATDTLSNVTATATYSMRLHAPEETIIGTRGEKVFSTDYRDSSSWTVPYGGQPVTRTFEFSSSVTVTAGLTGGLNFSPAGLKWITANLGFSVSGTAQVSLKQTASFNCVGSPTPGYKRRTYVRRRAYWDSCTVDYDVYDFNGYAEHRTTHGITFHSPDAASAANNDFDDEETWEDVPI